MAAVVMATERRLASSGFIHAFVCGLNQAPTCDVRLCELTGASNEPGIFFFFLSHSSIK